MANCPHCGQPDARYEAMEKALESPELMERLAAIEHERWSGWMRHLFNECEEHSGTVNLTIIPGWAVERWKRQMNTPYADLSEQEKESDRREVRKTLAALSLPAHSCAPTPAVSPEERNYITAAYDWFVKYYPGRALPTEWAAIMACFADEEVRRLQSLLENRK